MNSMAINWKPIIIKRAELWLTKYWTPLPLKELGWRLILFATKCGKSNPVSFGLRLIFDHKRTRVGIGGGLVLAMMTAIVIVPSTSMAANVGGKVDLTLASAGDVSPKTNTAVQIPIATVEISQRFWLLHPAIDMVTPVGTQVKPVMAGTVKMTSNDRFGYGNHVIVDHGNGYESLYAHLSKVSVKEGQRVELETNLGNSGSTGRSTGPHLHLEIHYEGKAVDPAPILGIK